MRKKGIVKKGIVLCLCLAMINSVFYPAAYDAKAAGSESVTAVSGKAAAANILNYEQNPSAKTFVINDIAGMEKLAELVNGGTDTFSGKTVTLQADLQYDKTVENNYTIIGTSYDNPFGGTFQGQNHKISGVNVKSGENYVGLFGFVEEGKIDGICLDDSIIAQTTQSREGVVGGIVGYNRGSISSCVVMHDTEVTGTVYNGCTGGIAGYTSTAYDVPLITKCVNYGTVKGAGRIGGIAGWMGSALYDVAIESCCNYGTIRSVIDRNVSVGGIAGTNDAGVFNCFNAGIFLEAGVYKDVNFGGIAGLSDLSFLNREVPVVANCYNVGFVFQGKSYGAITCASASKNNLGIENCYWLNGSSSVGVNTTHVDKGASCILKTVYKCNRDKMTSDAFVDELNRNSAALGYGEVWAKDTEGINNGYPILKNLQYAVTDDDHDSDYTPDVPDTDDGFDEIDTPEIETDIPDLTEVPHLFTDYDYQNPVTNSTITIHANGANVAVGSTPKTNYKRAVVYTDITASYNYTVNKKGTVIPSTGKVIVGITSSDKKPELVKGKIVDNDASKIAKASIISGQIAVTAGSQAGKVYLWLMDTGKKGTSVCCPVTVKMAPTILALYSVPDTDTDFAYGKTKTYTSGTVNVGKTMKIYLYPAYKNQKAISKTTNASFHVAVDDKSRDYFSVKQSRDNPLCYEVYAKNLKADKKVMGKITFTCKQNGRKVTFAVTAVNQVKGFTLKYPFGVTKTSAYHINIMTSKKAKVSGAVRINTVGLSGACGVTDNIRIYAMGSEDGYDAAKLETGQVKITKKRSTTQSKISVSVSKDKKFLNISTAKGTKQGVTAYYLIVYNTKNDGEQKGYNVISVTTE